MTSTSFQCPDFGGVLSIHFRKQSRPELDLSNERVSCHCDGNKSGLGHPVQPACSQFHDCNTSLNVASWYCVDKEHSETSRPKIVGICSHFVPNFGARQPVAFRFFAGLRRVVHRFQLISYTKRVLLAPLVSAGFFLSLGINHVLNTGPVLGRQVRAEPSLGLHWNWGRAFAARPLFSCAS